MGLCVNNINYKIDYSMHLYNDYENHTWRHLRNVFACVFYTYDLWRYCLQTNDEFSGANILIDMYKFIQSDKMRFYPINYTSVSKRMLHSL